MIADNAIKLRFLKKYTQNQQTPLQQTAFVLDVDTTLPGQGITTLVGSSGSGKTTLLRCIAGLEKPEKGHLQVNGHTWHDDARFMPTYKREVGYVFQEPSLFPHLTAKGNLNYAIKRARKPVSDIQYQEIVALMGIEKQLSQIANQLSGGERQRVAIARALLIQPQLLLMDEPMASLDAKRKQEIMPYLERLHETVSVPVIYVSHAMDEVVRLADHVVHMERGEIVAQGEPTQLYSHLGSSVQALDQISVILDGQIVDHDDQWQLSKVAFNGGECWVKGHKEALNEHVRLRIKAKDVSIALSNHDDSSVLNRIAVTVAEISDHQDPAQALVRLKAGYSYIIASITQRSVSQLNLKEGQQVWAQIKSVAIL